MTTESNTPTPDTGYGDIEYIETDYISFFVKEGEKLTSLKIEKWNSLVIIPLKKEYEGTMTVVLQLSAPGYHDTIDAEMVVHAKMQGDECVLWLSEDNDLLSELLESKRTAPSDEIAVLGLFHERNNTPKKEKREPSFLSRHLTVGKSITALGVVSFVLMEIMTNNYTPLYAVAQGEISNTNTGGISNETTEDLEEQLRALEIRILGATEDIQFIGSDSGVVNSQMPELRERLVSLRERQSSLEEVLLLAQVETTSIARNVRLLNIAQARVGVLQVISLIHDAQAEIAEKESEIRSIANRQGILEERIEGLQDEVNGIEGNLRYMSRDAQGILLVMPASMRQVFERSRCRLDIGGYDIDCAQITLISSADFAHYRSFGYVDWRLDPNILQGESPVYMFAPMPSGFAADIGIPIEDVSFNVSGWVENGLFELFGQ